MQRKNVENKYRFFIFPYFDFYSNQWSHLPDFFLSDAYFFDAHILMNEKNSQIYKNISNNCLSILFSLLMNANEMFMKEILFTLWFWKKKLQSL